MNTIRILPLSLLLFQILVSVSPMASAQTTQTANLLKQEQMEFKLLNLPYAEDALAPVISKETIEYHHGKHLKAYVTKLNELIKGSEYEGKKLVDIVKSSDGAVFNNAGQILNHNLYFLQFSPDGGGEPQGDLKKAIDEQFGSFEEFKTKFQEACTGLFGSGWTWLATNKDGKLEIVKEQNAGNPVTKDLTPLLGVDVWEHAYYIDYRNNRAEHCKKIWDIISWKSVGERYDNRGGELKVD